MEIEEEGEEEGGRMEKKVVVGVYVFAYFFYENKVEELRKKTEEAVT